MKKKILLITSIIGIALFIVTLYQTFAANSTVDTISSATYKITLTDSDIVSVPARTSKTIYYQITNTNKGKVQYGVGYNTTNSDIKVKAYWDSIDPATGFMDYGENKFVKLKISNYGDNNSEVKLSTVLGYENGGDLIPKGTTLVTETINEHNYMMEGTSGDATSNYLRTSLKKNQIGTITFVNDNIVPSGNNIVSVPVALNENDTSVMLWYNNTPDTNGLYNIYIGGENGRVSITTGYNLFCNLRKVSSIDLKYIDTSNVTNMRFIFAYCNALTSIDLSHFDTSNVTDMSYMFVSCFELSNLDLSGWNTSSVTAMPQMFSYCESLTSLDLSHFDTSNVTNMNSMFEGCTSLSTLNISNFNISQVTDVKYMFAGCFDLKILDLSNADINGIRNNDATFEYVYNIEKIYVKNSASKTLIMKECFFTDEQVIIGSPTA